MEAQTMVGVLLLMRQHPPRMAGCLVRGKEYEGSLGFDLFMLTLRHWFDHIDQFWIEYDRGAGTGRNGEQG